MSTYHASRGLVALPVPSSTTAAMNVHRSTATANAGGGDVDDLGGKQRSPPAEDVVPSGRELERHDDGSVQREQRADRRHRVAARRDEKHEDRVLRRPG